MVKPCKTDEWTGYRYYSEKEIVILNTVNALKHMGMSLEEIKSLLSYNDVNKIVEVLKKALATADEKIEELIKSKDRIMRAKNYYLNKLGHAHENMPAIRTIKERTILLSDKLSEPSLDKLWNYHRHFYAQVGEEKDEFTFEDIAGIYEKEDNTALFVVCTSYSKVPGLMSLPQGRYLCAECSDDNYKQVLKNLSDYSESAFGIKPDFSIRIVNITGILQWNYELQLYIGK